MPAFTWYLKHLKCPVSVLPKFMNLVYNLFFSTFKRANESTRILVTAIMGIAFGFFVGISISSVHLRKVITTTLVFLNVVFHIYHPINLFFCSLVIILQISLVSSPVVNSFDVPVAEDEIERFSAEVERSPAVIDESSGTKNLEVLGSIKLPKVFPCLFFRRMSMGLYSQKRKLKSINAF